MIGRFRTKVDSLRETLFEGNGTPYRIPQKLQFVDRSNANLSASHKSAKSGGPESWFNVSLIKL